MNITLSLINSHSKGGIDKTKHGKNKKVKIFKYFIKKKKPEVITEVSFKCFPKTERYPSLLLLILFCDCELWPLSFPPGCALQ